MENKIYKGAIRTVVFVNNTFQYGFVNTPWNDRELLMFQSGETKQGCRIPVIRDRSLGRSRQEGNRTIVTLKEPQTVFFRVSLNQKNEMVAVKLRDTDHVALEEMNAASLNSSKPTVRELIPDLTEVCLTAPTGKWGETLDAWFDKYAEIQKLYGNKDIQNYPEKKKKKRPNPKAKAIIEDDEEKSFGCDGDFALPYNKVRQSLAVTDNSEDEEEEFIEPVEEVEDVDDNKYDIYDDDDLYEDDDKPHKMRRNDDK